MDNSSLKKLLTEAKEIIETMINNIENLATLKFYAGKLSLLNETISSIIREN